MAEQEGPNPLNMDFQFLALMLLCASRADLYNNYLEGGKELDVYPNKTPKRWRSITSLGLDSDFLAECLFAFKDEKIRDAMLQMQRLTQTLVSLNDYCFIECPSRGACLQLIACILHTVENLATVDEKESVLPGDLLQTNEPYDPQTEYPQLEKIAAQGGTR
jgi:hypothetical protein